MALTKDFSYVDYSSTFANVPARNRILTNLNIFQRDVTDQFKTSLDILNAQADTIAPAANRFSSEWGSTPKPKAANHLIELPLFPTRMSLPRQTFNHTVKSALRYRPAFWMQSLRKA